MSSTSPADIARQDAGAFKATFGAIRTQVARMMVGQGDVIDGVLTALMAGGHVLLEGVPGLGKTMLVNAISRAVDLPFSRIQFTPDMMPADIIGTTVLADAAGGGHALTFQEGPIVANLVLADEINRATPKTQSALLEVMQERQVTVGRRTIRMPEPFCVMATQNPVDQEGTYPLPEAQLDRFLFKLIVGYPGLEEERAIVARYARNQGLPDPRALGVTPVVPAEHLAAAVAAVAQVTLAEPVADYVVRLIRATRESRELALGASPRAAVLLAGAARARAALAGRDYVLPDDVKALAAGVLRHRLALSPAAEIEGRQVEDLVANLVTATEAPR